MAASLQATQRELALNLARSNLYHALKERPTREELEQRGIMNDVASIEETAGALNFPTPSLTVDPLQESSANQRRTRNFVLTRLLLKMVAMLSEAGDISLPQKGYLKDLIVDQDPTILACAEVYESDGDLNDFKDTLLRLTQRQMV